MYDEFFYKRGWGKVRVQGEKIHKKKKIPFLGGESGFGGVGGGEKILQMLPKGAQKICNLTEGVVK
ncbi:MAG: hypothetical protein HFE47_07310 [Clostridia bacterium]|nr:hypothetical protein [Clostridia bacterium]